MENKDMRKKLWHSVDMAHVRLHIIIYIGFLLLGFAIGHLYRLNQHDPTFLPRAMIIFALSGLVFLIPALIICFRIYRDTSGYRLFMATLSQPHGGYPRGFMYFTIVLEEADGSKFIVNTNTVFQSYGTSFGPSMENYVNQTVTVAYNDNTGAVVVMG